LTIDFACTGQRFCYFFDMARKLRVQFEGAIYHVTIRGVDRRIIFDDDNDRKRFLECLGEAIEECGVRLYLFCLMSNHVHLMVETPMANLSAFMHKLQTAYTVYYNLRHKRAGHLMQGRFGAKPVGGNEYLLKLSRYVHLNPVYVGLMIDQPLERRLTELRSYPWSSYRGYAGLAKPVDFVVSGPILAMMQAQEKKRKMMYRRFVELGLAETDEQFLEILRGSRWGIGEDAFQERIRGLHSDMASHVKRSEDVSFRHVLQKIDPEQVLSLVADGFGIKSDDLRKRRYDCVARAVAVQMLGRYSGLNQRDIGGFLNMGTGSAVCRQLQRLRNQRACDSELNLRVEEIESIVARMQKCGR